jgi:hypothetical protein
MIRSGVLLLALVCAPAFGQVYKCKDAKGNTVFADMPCGASAQPVSVKPPRGDTPDGWRDEAWDRQFRNLKQRERAEAENEQRLKEIREANRPLDNLAADRKERRCSDLKRDLDVAESTVRNGAVHWQYNSAKARIPALQNQIKRDC